VVAFDDDSFDAIPDMAQRAGLTGVSREEPSSWRRLHGAFMGRLAVARPNVVAWDIFFRKEKPEHDEFLGRGIQALQETGARVVVAADAVDDQRRPLLAPLVREHSDAWGWLYLARSEILGAVNGSLLAVHDPPGEISPSLALATFIAHRYPRGRTEIGWEPTATYVELFHSDSDSGRAESRQRFFLSDGIPEWPGRDAAAKTSRRSAGCLKTIVPPREVLERYTLSYRAAFDLEDAELRRRFEGRIILVGDTRLQRTAAPDRKLVIAGTGKTREEFSCFVHAMAICDLLHAITFRRPGLLPLYALAALGVLAGLVTGRWAKGERGRMRPVLAAALWAAAVFSVALLAASASHVLLNPTSLTAAVWIAFFGASWVGGVARTTPPAQTTPSESKRMIPVRA
jgi:CHASE2 domain-containing sensor protein